MSKTITKQFLKYTLPTVAAMLVNGLYQVVDGIFIGQYVGADGLAAINVAWPIIGAVLGIGMMVGVGTGAVVSINQGAGNKDKAKSILSTGLIFLFLLFPVLSLFLWQYADSLLLAQGVEGEVFQLAKQYIDVLIVSSLFSLGSIAIPFLLRNDNSPNFATVLMIIGAVVNIALDYLFIAVMGWELEGAAIATAMAQFVVTLMGVGYFFSRYATMKLSLATLSFRVKELPEICSIGLSSFFMYLYGSAMVAVHNWMFTQFGNVVMIGAYAIIGYVVTIYYLTVEGIANGMQPLVSFNHGGKNREAVAKLFNLAAWSSVLLGIAFVLLLNIYPEQIIAVFNSEDAELMTQATLGIRLHMFALFLDGFIVVAGAYYQAVGQSKKAMFVTIGNMAVQIPFLFTLPYLFGLVGVWIAYPLSNIALSIVIIWMIRREFTNSSSVENGYSKVSEVN
ncbi:MATE family efflux transporter [Vibrio sp. 99-8-1]|uniref:MATE family efflux transporter n=1 Tax=Vibrio sp. 99-8-1 TaxID=2607602 RepID=UPI0014935918|nr:MATE family efflux transporter [Vibrio sp. 99-8-1]NOI64818.1 MATE family efflux transporter [Vibrio sp. 99-8-1]